MDGFITPPNHVNFSAKKLFANMGEIIDGSIAYLDESGGGPTELHTHTHNHLFIVVKGEAKIKYAGSAVIIKENDSYLVKGETPHSVWNNGTEQAIMIGLSVENSGNSRLSKFEDAYQDLQNSMTELPAKLEELRIQGKEKTVTYKELLTQKLINNNILMFFEKNGITGD